MRHKYQGIPTKGWLVSYLRRFMDQRATFELAPESPWWKLCTAEGAFGKGRPIFVSGVFCGLMKRPRDWPDLYAKGPVTLYLSFRSVLFKQGDATARHPFARTHRRHKRQDVEFELSEIRGLALAERLNAMLPRLGHTPGRINCSEGSSAKGFPSKQEPPPPPRGSDLLDGP